MCDFSLEANKSRAAVVGDRLITRELGPNKCIGLVEPAHPDVAVCVEPGSRLAFSLLPKTFQEQNYLRELGNYATFSKQGSDDPLRYHDSVRFDEDNPDAFILLQFIPPLVSVEVLSIGAAPGPEIYVEPGLTHASLRALEDADA
jgi:hypothetical protein